MPRCSCYALALVCICWGALPAHGISIVLDYTHDTYFQSSNPTAVATLNKAAADISAAITSSLSAITSDVYNGSFGGSTASANWSFAYTNPTTGAKVVLPNATIAGGQIRIYVGGRSISASNTLGVGGPASMEVSATIGGGGTFQQTALDQVANSSTVAYRRGAGPRIGSFDSLSFSGGATYNFDVDYGVAYGNLWFDLDRNNDGQQDSASTLNGYWHWDYNTAVAAGKNDLYSVALHEILHAVGFGTGATWDSLQSGTTWTGSNAVALNGTGVGLVDGGHIAQAANSVNIYTGATQKPVLVPTLTSGTRRFLTSLDLAFLRDLGFSTVALTPPALAGDYNDDGIVSAADYTVWRDTNGMVGTGLAADGNNSGSINAADYTVWRTNFGRMQATLVAAAPIPEPPTWLMLAVGLFLLARHALLRPSLSQSGRS